MIIMCMQFVLGNVPHNKSCSKDLSNHTPTLLKTHTRVTGLTHFAEEGVEHSDEVAQCQVIVGHHSLDLIGNSAR